VKDFNLLTFQLSITVRLVDLRPVLAKLQQENTTKNVFFNQKLRS